MSNYTSRPLDIVHEQSLETQVPVENPARMSERERPWVRAASVLLGDLIKARQEKADALIDPVTNLPNRRALEEVLPRYREHTQHTGTRYLIGVGDANDLDLANNTKGYGHATGDEYLLGSAKGLTASVRPGDEVFRIGGDEFAIIMIQNEDTPEVSVVEKTFRQRLASELEQQVDKSDSLKSLAQEHGFKPAIAIGMAEWDGEQPFERAFRIADERMYQNKAELKGLER